MSFFNKYPGIRLAKLSDSQSIQDFYAQAPMDASNIVLTYIREPDFFTFLNYQGDEVLVFVLFNQYEDLAGVGTLTIREGYVNESTCRIGYLSDLRINSKLLDREIAHNWKAFYGELVENSKTIEELRCDYLITAIMAGNKKAKNSLVNKAENTFHYEKICDYNMINIIDVFGKINHDKNIIVSRCDDMSEVLDYLESVNQKRTFGFTRKFIQNAIVQWHNLNLNQFIKVELNGEIIGLCATWNPSPIKKIIFDKLPLKLKVVNKLASLITKTPKEGNELEIQYLSFLSIDNKNALGAIIDFLKKEGVFKEYHLLAFADYNHSSYLKTLKGAVIEKTPLELYQVVSKKCMDDIIELKGIPGFEISLV